MTRSTKKTKQEKLIFLVLDLENEDYGVLISLSDCKKEKYFFLKEALPLVAIFPFVLIFFIEYFVVWVFSNSHCLS